MALVRTAAAGGWLRLYEGTRPASPDSAAGTTVVAELHLASPAFSAPANNSMAFSAPASTDVLVDDAVPTWFRLFEANGTTAIADGTIGASGEFELSGARLLVGLTIDISGASLSLTQT